MKEVKEERFTRKEDVGFNPAPVLDAPPAKRVGEAVADERSNERTNIPRPQETPPMVATAYVISIPPARQKTRQSFDIFADQYEALKKLQLAEAERAAGKTIRKLGDMVQEALDAFIGEKAKRLGNITVVKNQKP